MKLTRDFILTHIRESNYPCWALYALQSYRRTPLLFYNGDDWQDGDDASAKTEKAIKRLEAFLDQYPGGAALSIDLKSSKGANGTQGTIGPLEFTNIDKETQEAQQTQPAPLGGFGYMPAGWITEETLNAKLEGMQAANDRKVQDILFQHKVDAFKEHCNREREELKALRRELNDEKRKYESNTGAAAETLVFAIKKILGELFPALPFGNSAPAQSLGAPDQDQAPQDEKYKAVEHLANYLYENKDFDANDISDITSAIAARGIKTTSQPTQPTQQGTVVQFSSGQEGAR